ncbi:MAG: hypothetical protein HeimC2_23440 [Candidatus Heimdallarchaeota archaeon LC_2]|nr:MAG: hypothetical protein HeimC2_23440 [Candidatus Heimdallarchaeota archaeon LC_2]
MSNIYVTKLNSLFEKLFSDNVLSRKQFNKLQIKNFFGGGAAYIQNHIFMTLTKVGLALKLSDDDLQNIMKIGGKELRYFAKVHIKKQYSIIPNNIISSSKEFSNWIRKSLNFVLTD